MAYIYDRHVRHYRAAIQLLAWIEDEGLTFDSWMWRTQSDHNFIDGLGVVAHDRDGKVWRNALIFR